MPPVAAVIGVVAAIGGTFLSVKSQKKAARKAREREANASRRSRRNAIRQAQIRRAQALASAEAVGAGGSSATAGGVASTNTRLGSLLGFQSQQSGLARDISRAQGQAGLFQGVAGLGSTLFNLSGGVNALPSFGNNDRDNKIPDLSGLP